MRAILLTSLLGLGFAAAGCTTGQPSAFIPPPIPPHPTMARTATPAPEPSQTVAPAPEPTRPQASPYLAVISKSQWTSERPITSRLDPMGRVTCITVHHEGDATVLANSHQVSLHLQDIRKVHTKDRGYGDIAYHFLIDAQGNVWEGRSLAYQGAHAGNNDANRGNIGICLLGDFEASRPSPAQKAALQKLLARLMAQYHVSTRQVYTHREVKAKFGLGTTDCPGRNLQSYMDDVRQQWRSAGR